MAWVAFDRAANEFAAEGPAEAARHLRAVADEIHADACERGFERDLEVSCRLLAQNDSTLACC